MRVFLFGLPYNVGGAMVEAGDTALLWRRAGIDVTCIAPLECPCGKPMLWPHDTKAWSDRLTQAGVEIVMSRLDEIKGIDGIRDSMVVAFCNTHCLHMWSVLEKTGCRLVWVPCMTYTNVDETKAFGIRPPSAVVFQSQYQYSKLQQEYADYGCDKLVRIHGAFTPLMYRNRVRTDRPFTVGRLARASFSKWPTWLWSVLGNARQRIGWMKALCQGWDPLLDRHCGTPPEWAECMPSGTMTSQEFLDSCDVLINANFSVTENWPRVGLEAMSAGVPLIVDDSGGWREMCGPAAIYCKQPLEFADAIVLLAEDDEYRQAIVDLGFYRVMDVAEPAETAQKWCDLFGSL